MTYAAAPNEYFKFFNGQLYPALGYGTWQATEKELEPALEAALEAGYRHIDTAYVYGNEPVIGKVLNRWISSGKIKREDIFLVTKLPAHGNRPEGVKKFIEESLKNLQVDYVDLFLIHNPVGFKDMEPVNGKREYDLNTDHVALWKGMEELVDNGKAKSIGLSNFNINQVQRVLDNARIQPANLQVELHAFHQQNELVNFCKKHNIIVTAYSPLFNPNIDKFYARFGLKKELPKSLSHPVITEIAKKHNKTPAQVLLRQIVQRGIVAIPKSVTPERLRENINIFDFKLDDNDMKQIAALDQGLRLLTFEVIEGFKDHPEYPFPELR